MHMYGIHDPLFKVNLSRNKEKQTDNIQMTLYFFSTKQLVPKLSKTNRQEPKCPYSMFPIKRTVFLCIVTLVKNRKHRVIFFHLKYQKSEVWKMSLKIA